MRDELFKEEPIYFVNDWNLSVDSYEAFQKIIRDNEAVGFIAGYYDEKLSISNVSEFFLHNLGYTFEEFLDITEGSLYNVFYGENRSFLAKDKFKVLQGRGEAEMVRKRKFP